MKEVPVSARDTIRLEEAISNATAEFVAVWTERFDARLGLTRPLAHYGEVDDVIEHHSFIINQRFREIAHSLRKMQLVQNPALFTIYKNEARDALLGTELLKPNTVDDLIDAALV